MPETRRTRARANIKEVLEQVQCCQDDTLALTKRFEDYMELEVDDHDQLVILQDKVRALEERPFNLESLNFLGRLLFKIIGK